MRVFVLCTGRCGSVTFSKACEHVYNYTVGHESRADMIGSSRLTYPDNHIEVDNRLSWMLGRLDRRYGGAPFYVHLTRDTEDVISSFADRHNRPGIMRSYGGKQGIIMGDVHNWRVVAEDYVKTVTENIRLFLKDKDYMRIPVENAREKWPYFWDSIGAEGDFEKSVNELGRRYNAR